MNMKKYNILSLFSGCGGLDYGFEQEGFAVPFANEFWKPAQDSFESSHPNTVLFKECQRKQEPGRGRPIHKSEDFVFHI